MRNDVIQANVVMAKCNSARRPFGIRIEQRLDQVWHCTWAFELSEKAAGNEGYGATMISGRVDVDDEYPGCPYCKATGWVSCGSCKKLTCWDGNTDSFTCTWCNTKSTLRRADTFDLSGGGY